MGEREGGVSGKVYEPGLDLGTPEAQHLYIFPHCHEAIGVNSLAFFFFLNGQAGHKHKPYSFKLLPLCSSYFHPIRYGEDNSMRSTCCRLESGQVGASVA